MNKNSRGGLLSQGEMTCVSLGALIDSIWVRPFVRVREASQALGSCRPGVMNWDLGHLLSCKPMWMAVGMGRKARPEA